MADVAIHLRPFQEADLDLLARFATDPSFSQPFEWFGYRSPEGFRRRWKEDGFLSGNPRYLAIAVADGGAIGWVAWHESERSQGVWEIGALLGPENRGRGFGTTAQRLLVQHLFATTPVRRIWAGTEVDNVREQRSLEKCGFRREGLLRGAHFRDGQWRDSLIYGLLRDDEMSQ